MTRLIVKHLSWIASFHIQERCGKHASKLKQWSILGCLPTGSEAICTDGSYGGLERQTVGRTKSSLNGFYMFVGMLPLRLMPRAYFNKQLKIQAKTMLGFYRRQVFTRTREIDGSNFI